MQSNEPGDVTLWHYTDAAGAIGILQSRTLRATALSHLNDATELIYGLDLARSILEECIKSDLPAHRKDLLASVKDRLAHVEPGEYFVACASRAEDDLSQWRGYGGGYSLGIHTDLSGSEIEWVVDGGSVPNIVRLSASPYDPGREPFGSWHEVIYDKAKQRSLLRDLIDNLREPHSLADAPEIWLGVIVSRVACFKSSGFSAERECRVIVPRPRRADMVSFRSGPFGVTPYVSLSPVDPASADTNAYASQRGNPLPVVKVTVGPTHTPTAARAGMQRLLHSLSLDSVPVTPSSSTYRHS